MRGVDIETIIHANAARISGGYSMTIPKGCHEYVGTGSAEIDSNSGLTIIQIQLPHRPWRKERSGPNVSVALQKTLNQSALNPHAKRCNSGLF